MLENTGPDEPQVQLIARENRDPMNRNSFLEVDFTDVIAEPDGFHSHERLYNCAFQTFNCTKNCCYLFLTFLCGGPLAFCFGCYFACLGFEYIWCVMPCTQACLMGIRWIGEIFGYCIKAFCDPCFDSIGRMFSKIHVKTENV
ncbi:caveolin-1-like [Orbicella faveolata]|uniref:caveolin-1-like n=1 Tax=Orbicella faveolata TaxID=48498 RepID=UPI0009E3B71C|nr:caveolin-1-like [Orbicella faveolata]